VKCSIGREEVAMDSLFRLWKHIQVRLASSVSYMINSWTVSKSSSPNHRSISAVWRRWDASGDNRVHRPLSEAAHLLWFQAMSRGVSPL